MSKCVALGYEANCKNCINREKLDEGGYRCVKLDVANPHFIACCHYRTRKDTEKSINKRRELRKRFWQKLYSERTNDTGYKYSNITPKYRKYIGEN